MPEALLILFWGSCRFYLIINIGLHHVLYFLGEGIELNVIAQLFGKPNDDGSPKTFNMVGIQIDID